MINTHWSAKTLKGAANNHRVRIMVLLDSTPGLTLGELAEKLKISDRTASEHTKKLVSSGLINKRYQASYVSHELTPLGKRLLSVIERLNKR